MKKKNSIKYTEGINKLREKRKMVLMESLYLTYVTLKKKIFKKGGLRPTKSKQVRSAVDGDSFEQFLVNAEEEG